MGGVVRKMEVIIFPVKFSDVRCAEVIHFIFKNTAKITKILSHAV